MGGPPPRHHARRSRRRRWPAPDSPARPARAFEYSNLGYGAIGRAVRADHRPPDAGPGGRARAGAARASGARPGCGRPTMTGPVRTASRTAGPSPTPCRWVTARWPPMGGLWSTVEDLAAVVSWFDDAFPPRDDIDVGPLASIVATPAAAGPAGQRGRAAPGRRARGSITSRSASTAADTGSGCRSSTTSGSGTSPATPGDCPATARTCAGCPVAGSASSRSPTRRTRRCAC